jgi:hypothetical protein
VSDMVVLLLTTHSTPQGAVAPWSYCALDDCKCSLPKVCLLDDDCCPRLKVCVNNNCDCDRPKACVNPYCECGCPKVITPYYGGSLSQ